MRVLILSSPGELLILYFMSQLMLFNQWVSNKPKLMLTKTSAETDLNEYIMSTEDWLSCEITHIVIAHFMF